jgi:hypothetical protein
LFWKVWRAELQKGRGEKLVEAATLHEAERLIESCEHCNPDGAESPFDAILDRVIGSDPSVTDYILEGRQSAHDAFGRLPRTR